MKYLKHAIVVFAGLSLLTGCGGHSAGMEDLDELDVDLISAWGAGEQEPEKPIEVVS